MIIIPIYQFLHPETGEIFEELLPIKKANKPFFAPDGKRCKRLTVPTNVHGGKGNKEVFEADPDYVKIMKPKYVKYNDGHRERYDSSKHCWLIIIKWNMLEKSI